MSFEEPIVIENLSKRYGKFTAVDDLSISVKKNSFTGLLGPNGAGKSTTLKIMSNLTKKSSGSIYLNNIDVTKNPSRALERVGTVVETPEFYADFTPRQTFRHIGRILGMKKETVMSETDEILEKVKMTQWADKKLGTFSKGMRQRIALGQALLNSPEIIILDEPTSGLDPRGIAEMREILKELRRQEGLTILMSSHILHEVNDLCDRVAMVSHGKLLVHDDIENIADPKAARKISVKLVDEMPLEIVERIGSLSNVSNVVAIGKKEVEVEINGGINERAQLLSDIMSLNMRIYNFSESESGLEASYLELIKESV